MNQSTIFSERTGTHKKFLWKKTEIIPSSSKCTGLTSRSKDADLPRFPVLQIFGKLSDQSHRLFVRDENDVEQWEQMRNFIAGDEVCKHSLDRLRE